VSLAEDVNGIAEIIRTKFSGSTVHLFQEPESPGSGEFGIELKQEIRRSESRSHTIIERQYRIHSYGNHAESVVVPMGELSRFVMNEMLHIPMPEGTGAGRVESFTIDMPEKLGSGLLRCTGTLVLAIREAVVMSEYQKIGSIEIRTVNN